MTRTVGILVGALLVAAFAGGFAVNRGLYIGTADQSVPPLSQLGNPALRGCRYLLPTGVKTLIVRRQREGGCAWLAPEDFLQLDKVLGSPSGEGE
jgi:hypothetical protein